MKCPDCGQPAKYEVKKDTWTYGTPQMATCKRLSAYVPVIVCEHCKQSFTDYLAEDIREAVTQEYVRETTAG